MVVRAEAVFVIGGGTEGSTLGVEVTVFRISNPDLNKPIRR